MKRGSPQSDSPTHMLLAVCQQMWKSIYLFDWKRYNVNKNLTFTPCSSMSCRAAFVSAVPRPGTLLNVEFILLLNSMTFYSRLLPKFQNFRPVGVAGEYHDISPLTDTVILTNVHSRLEVAKKGKNPGEGKDMSSDEKEIIATARALPSAFKVPT